MPSLIKIVTWNVDWQGDSFRWKKIIENISSLNPDIVLIQEATFEFAKYAKTIWNNYQLFGDISESYFVFMAFKKTTIQIKQAWHIPFPNSKMGRKICAANIKYNNQPLLVMTSHLESEKPNSTERKSQFKTLLKAINESKYPVIFGGDTNLRIHEVYEVGGLPRGIYDLWECMGKPEDCKITWDVQRKPIPIIPLRFAGGRYDRIFFKSTGSWKLTPSYLKPLGKQEISKGIYASDHLGLSFGFVMSKG